MTTILFTIGIITVAQVLIYINTRREERFQEERTARWEEFQRSQEKKETV